MKAERTPLGFADLEALDFGKAGGLLPAIVQHADTRAVLMLGYMNREAVVASLTRRRVVFFSRSKVRLWEKGETSGHWLELGEIRADCDRDALLVTASPRGPVCHLGSGSCFGEAAPAGHERMSFLATLEEVIAQRIATPPEGSYTAKLLSQGWKGIAQKVGEEGVEVALAGTAGSDSEVIDEVSDLLYHVLVLLKARGLSLKRVMQELRGRHEGV
ncbi:MAG: bifunctional phosphoribosyl-AMP cyclohydrolase/phosphoribosyl-ATP diphosphatase HisIE [Steroidobacteraceae bacterium]